jgi:hypothetical protein
LNDLIGLGRFKKSLKVILGRDYARRDIHVYPDDTFITSYPKSGNTWVRFMLGNLIYPNLKITFVTIEQLISDIYQHTNYTLNRIPRPRILKSHEYFDPRYKNIIYITRDPRDVAVSYYYHCLKMRVIDKKCKIEDFIDIYVSGGLDTFGSWAENIASWIFTKRNSEKFLLLRYEDMISNPIKELQKMAQFLAKRADKGELERAVRLSSSEHMRKIEKKEGGIWKPIKRSRKDIPFVRSATANNWKNILPDHCVKKITATFKDVMLSVGYLSSRM